MTEKGIPVHWEEDSELHTNYINQMFVTHSGGDFYVVFGELSPPVRNENMDLPDKIYVKPIFRMALTPRTMKEFLDVLNSNYDLFKEKK